MIILSFVFVIKKSLQNVILSIILRNNINPKIPIEVKIIEEMNTDNWNSDKKNLT